MNPVVVSALISAVATIVSVSATAAVAIVGFRISRSTNQATIDAAHADVRRTLDATRDGQIADRYSKAVEQLGSSTIDVTIGGIYALERIAYDSPRDHPTVMEVLAACIREHSPKPWPKPSGRSGAEAPERTTRPDIQAALTVIGRRDAAHDQQPIDLTRANLTRADLTEANLIHANLTAAVLTRAFLTEAVLSEANLTAADLTGARLARALLAEANLTRADLTDASLPRVNLTGARLPHANLTGARLTGARLTGADLTRANLTNANVTEANLTRANLYSANLTGARLTGADLTEANLTSANLYGADLTGADLTGADFTSAYLTNALWPAGSPAPEGWAQDPGPSPSPLKRATRAGGTGN